MRARSGLAVLMLGLFVLTLSASAAMAQAINDAGAAQLKTDIEHALERRAASFDTQSEGASLQRDGELTVTPQNGYYAVVMPHLSLKSADGGTMDIGVIKINAIPAGPDMWRVTMAFPTPLTGFDATGVPRVKMSLGKQQFSGVWHAKYDSYLETDMDYNDIRVEVTEPGKEGQFEIGNMRGSMKLDDMGNGKYSGPYNVTLENTRFSGTDQNSNSPTTGSIARIEVKGRMVNADMQKAADFQRNMESRTEGMQGMQDNPDPETSKAIINDLMDYMTSFADDFDTAVNLQGVDVNINQPAGPGSQGEPVRLQMDKVGFGFSMDGMNRNTMTMKMNYGVEDLNILPTPPAAMGYMPMSIMINFAAENLPHKFLSGMLTDQINADIDMQSGQSTQAPPNPGQTMMDAKNAMSSAGTVLRVDGTRLSAGGLDARLTGDIRASATAMMGAVMDVRLVIKGIDTVMASLSDPSTPPEVVQQSMGILGMLQSMGKPEAGADGGTVLVYNLQLTEDGRALLNGNPMPVPGLGGGMGGGMQGGMNEGPMPLP